MPFFDAAAYAAHLRTQNALQSGLTTGLSFDPSGAHLAALSTSGHVSIHSLNREGASAVSSSQLSSGGIALATGEAGVYAASKTGLERLNWCTATPSRVLDSVHVRAVANVAHAVVAAALAPGGIALVDEERGEAVGLIGGEAVRCLAALPADGGQFLAGCDDGTLRYYDCRAGRTAVRTVRLQSSSAITCLATNMDGTFVVAGEQQKCAWTVHVGSSSTVGSLGTPLIPQVAAFASGSFYIGGSDCVDPKQDPVLIALDLQCRPATAPAAPASVKGVYALAVHPGTGLMAAGGYSRLKSVGGVTGEVVDVYMEPPVRSFSFVV